MGRALAGLVAPGQWQLAGNGEADIMEYVGEKDWASAAVHGPVTAAIRLCKQAYFEKSNDITAGMSMPWTGPDS